MPNESLLATHLFMFTGFMRVRWCSGMRFKMAFETEDSSRIGWFMGTIASFGFRPNSLAQFPLETSIGIGLGREQSDFSSHISCQVLHLLPCIGL
ncbi:unnamed protein product [Prunus brigantina]